MRASGLNLQVSGCHDLAYMLVMIQDWGVGAELADPPIEKSLSAGKVDSAIPLNPLPRFLFALPSPPGVCTTCGRNLGLGIQPSVH